MKIKILIVLAIAITTLLSGNRLNAREAPPAPVNVAPAQMKALSPVAWVSGNIVSRNNSQIAAEVAGRLVSLAEIGAEVKQGEVIARIDDKSLQIQRKEDQANVESAQARLLYLESEVERKASLAKRNLSAKNELDETLSERDIAKGNLTAAKAQLAQTLQQLEYTQLRAPFDGVIVSRLSNLGEYVNSGTPLVQLVETSRLEVSAYAPLTAYRFLKQVSRLAVKSPLGEGTAPIKTLVPVAERQSHLMEIRLDMSEFDWPVGLDVKVAVASGDTKQVLAVPRDALVLRIDGVSIFRVSPEGKAEKISVTVGIGAGELVEVQGKVQVGDQIIIRGAERLQPGQAVRIRENNDALISGKAES